MKDTLNTTVESENEYNNKWSHPGLKIFIQKQHPVLHSSALKPCFKSALRIDSVSSRCWRHRCWSLRAPLPLSFLFSAPTVSSRLNCFFFSSFSHCTFHCKTLLFLNPLVELSVSLAHFFPSSSFLSIWLLHSYWWERFGSGTHDAGPAPCQQGLKIQGLGPWRWKATQLLSSV